jgi:Undecaprenyl-phosphate galactose phosphotransferase WbaP
MNAREYAALDNALFLWYDYYMTLTEFELWYRARYHGTSSIRTTLLFIIADLSGVMLSFGTGFFLVNLYDNALINFRSFVTYWPYLPVFIMLFGLNGLYPGIALAPSEELRHFAIGSFITHGGIIISRYIEDADLDPITMAFSISFVFSLFILLFCRSSMRFIMTKTKFHGVPAVIFGNGSTAKLIAERLLRRRHAGYDPALILDDDPESGETYRGIPVIHNTGLGPEIVKKFNIKMAIVAMPHLSDKEFAGLLNGSVSAFRYNVVVPNFFSAANIWMTMRDFDGILGFVTSHKLKMFWNLGFKRILDLTATFIGGLFIAPFLLFIAFLIKISSPGPVLYGHTRIGLDGKHFKAWKFRSMAKDADAILKKMLDSDPVLKEEWEASHKLRDDPRVTKIGKILRKFSLDEFPQLINVLTGEMSLVGPRPVVDAEAEKYGEDFKRIFSAKPGMTGLWQVSGRSDTDYAERVAYDSYYLQSWSIWLDLWILYKTIGVVLRGKGAY